ncbi:MAG TPA: ABC transporter permease [Polyangia bacterium]|jgi:NitT/TauT family transport system permease protein
MSSAPVGEPGSTTPPSKTVQRAEFVRETLDSTSFGVVEKPIPLWRRILQRGEVRKLLIILALGAIWQLYTIELGKELLFPRLTSTLKAFYEGIRDGDLLLRSWFSVKVLLQGYALGVALATLLTIAAITSQVGNDLLETLTAMFNPVPGVALLPLAMLWFGLGSGALIFVLIHSVVWAVALNTHSGFKSVSPTLRMVGRNYGLSGFRYVWKILIPAAFPSILTGLKVSWAFAWRTLIASELVFGVTSNSGGLGWFIYENKNQLEIPSVFAGLFMVILIGLFMDAIVFRQIEQRTVRKWGMQA